MRQSIYNHTLRTTDGKVVIYNALSDNVLLLLPELHEIYENYMENPEEISRIHPDFFEALKGKGFIVEDSVDEYEEALKKVKEQERNEGRAQITINPTLDCNFRCWYCYEKHLSGSKMSDTVYASCLKFLEKTIKRDDIKHVVLSFFGGEPLLYYADIVKPLIEFSKACAETNGKNIDFYMTTNGFLLSESVVEDLSEIGVLIDFQIAIDGNEEGHNKIKFLKGGTGTYTTVIQNIIQIAKKGHPVTVRCNYSSDTIKSFVDVAEDLTEIASYENVTVSFHKIWQASESEQLEKDFAKVVDAFREKGFFLSISGGENWLCYADQRNNAVLNYDGRVYVCTARNFGENHVGILSENGDIAFNERYEQRFSVKYKSDTCKRCKIFPTCMQGCSQDVLEYKDINQCVRDNSPHAIEKVVKERVCRILPQARGMFS